MTQPSMEEVTSDQSTNQLRRNFTRPKILFVQEEAYTEGPQFIPLAAIVIPPLPRRTARISRLALPENNGLPPSPPPPAERAVRVR